MNLKYKELMWVEPELFRNSGEQGEICILTDEEQILQVERALHLEIGIIYEDEYVRLVRDAVIFPDMSKGTHIRLLSRCPQGAVAVLPVSGGKILLLRHFRHSLRKWMWEIPRGFGGYGLTVEENAEKELREETGISGVRLEYLGRICPDSGMNSDQVSVFFAEFSTDYLLEKLDKKEAISEYRLISREELQEMVGAEDMLDGFTLSAVALAGLCGKL